MQLPTDYDSWLTTEPAPKAIATTWNNDPIHDGEEVYQTPSGDYILADNLQEWVEHNIGKSFDLWKEDL